MGWTHKHSQILAGIALFPSEILEHDVEATCKQRSQQRAEPVDPKVSGEALVHDCRTERVGGIQQAASKVSMLVNQFTKHQYIPDLVCLLV
jgi:hypothetical protein